jgi:hypothetical protein
MCTSLQKKGTMFRMVPNQFFSTLIIVQKNLKNPADRPKQKKNTADLNYYVLYLRLKFFS